MSVAFLSPRDTTRKGRCDFCWLVLSWEQLLWKLQNNKDPSGLQKDTVQICSGSPLFLLFFLCLQSLRFRRKRCSLTPF